MFMSPAHAMHFRERRAVEEKTEEEIKGEKWLELSVCLEAFLLMCSAETCCLLAGSIPMCGMM